MSALLERVLGEVNTAQGVLEPSFDINHIIPYPYSSNVELINGEPVPYLSKLSQASIDSAAIAWKAHPESKVILIGETCYGDDLPNTTDLMIARGQEQGIDLAAFLPIFKLPDGRPLNNTYLQTEALAGRVKKNANNSDTDLVIGMSYHLRRIARTVRAYRHLKKIKFAAAETLLWADGDHSYDCYAPFTKELHEKDLRLEVINLFDRRGKMLNRAAKKSGNGARIVDVIQKDDGELELENDFAIPKLERLLAQSQQQTEPTLENG